MRIRLAAAVATATTALFVAGCGGDVDGTAVAANSSGDVDSLDTGNFSTDPIDFGTVTAGDIGPSTGAMVEGQRTAEFVIAPHTIDPTLVESIQPTGISIGGVGMTLPDPASDIVARHGFLYSFDSARTTADSDRTLIVTAFRFPDAESARAAATELRDAQMHPTSEYSTPEAELPIPALPGTLATLSEAADTSPASTDSTSIQTFTPAGEFVVYTWTKTPGGDRAWADDVTNRAVRAQVDLIGRFPVTPADRLDALPMDVDGVLNRTLQPLENEDSYNVDSAVYGPQGVSHLQTDPAASLALFEETGTDRIAKTSRSTVYRTDSADDARKVADAWFAEAQRNYPQWAEVTPPADVPDTRCIGGDLSQGRGTVCFMVYDRYVAEMPGFAAIEGETDTESNLGQAISAQYVLFRNAEAEFGN